jgi:hypothetical protein
MKPGTVLVDDHFVYSNGETGKKLLVVLGSTLAPSYIVIKTTSRPAHKGSFPGCQLKDRIQNFYLPEGSCFLHGETWLLLNDVFEFDRDHFAEKTAAGELRRIGNFDAEILKELLECVVQIRDIKRAHRTVLQGILANF